jgi:hypothetical protein
MQNHSKLWSAFLAVSVFTFTAPALVHSQSSREAGTEPSMKSAERNSPCSPREQHAPGKTMHDSSSMKSTQSSMKSTLKEQNPCDDPNNSAAYQRDMEQRFPHSTPPNEDQQMKSKEMGS